MKPDKYAVVLGEALIDLLDTQYDGELVYRQAIGGAPLNVAVGIARLGGAVEFVGALGDDALADRIIDLLKQTGVGHRSTIRVPTSTALAVVTCHQAEPDFRFYGEPRSYLQYPREHLDTALIANATVLYCGSISLLDEPFLSTARAAWATPGPLRVFDPNVRPNLLTGDNAFDQLRRTVEEFAATADLIKLSADDAHILYEAKTPQETLEHLRALGARATVITCGAQGALISHPGGNAVIPAPQVQAVDTTGAGDSVMAALTYRLLADGPPGNPADWRDRITFALHVAGLVVEKPGGAAAMPTLDELHRRFHATAP